MESRPVIHDGVGIAHMGHPTAPYLSLNSRPNPAWKGRGSFVCGCALFPMPCCGSDGPHPGHVSLARPRPVGQAVSHQPGPHPVARLSALNRGKGEGFPPILSPFFNRCHFSFLLFAKPVCVPWWFLGERRAKRGREKLTDSFMNPGCDVELEAIQRG